MKAVVVKILGAYLDVVSRIAPSQAARHGFLLFCRPFRPPINEKQRAFLDESDQFTLNHEGFSVQGYRWGTGPKKVLFIHGWQSHSYRWKPYIEALSKEDYTIYALDAPGHGLSGGNFLSVPLYSSLIDTFIRDAGGFHTVIAHSIGGFSLLYSLYRERNLPVSKAILLAPPGEATDFIANFRQTLNVSDRTLSLVIDHFKKRYQVTPDFFSAQRFAQHIDVDGLIIHDQQDSDAPYHYSVRLHQAWKRSSLITTKGYGHNLKSPAVVKHVVDFIADAVHQDVVE